MHAQLGEDMAGPRVRIASGDFDVAFQENANLAGSQLFGLSDGRDDELLFIIRKKSARDVTALGRHLPTSTGAAAAGKTATARKSTSPG